MGPAARMLGDAVARVPGGAAVGGLVAAAAAGPAATGADWVVDDGTEPGLAAPQPAIVMSATSAATVTGKRLFIPPKTPNSSTRLRSTVGETLNFNVG
jgi:hypothetical protein